MASIDFSYWIKEIISHPNTPAYIQAVAVILATYAGLNYLKKRAAERKFDLVVKTYKYCLEACDVLISLKKAPVLFPNRNAVENYQAINKERFVDIVSNYAESYLNLLDQERLYLPRGQVRSLAQVHSGQLFPAFF